jgi:hypothetical protein
MTSEDEILEDLYYNYDLAAGARTTNTGATQPEIILITVRTALGD